MGTLDWIILALFFLVMIGIIVYVIRQKEKDTTDYFLAGKDAGWLSIGSSIFASNIGSEHLVGLAGAGFISGMAMAHWEIQAWIILILGWVFVPFYDRIKIFTMPEYLERRFSAGSRTILSLISLVSYVLTKVAVTVYAGGVVFKEVFGIETLWGIDFFWVSAIGLVVITGLLHRTGRDESRPLHFRAAIPRFADRFHCDPGDRTGKSRRMGGSPEYRRPQHSPDPVGCRSGISLAGGDRGFHGDRILVLVYRPVHCAACPVGT